jgi:hypothetical protein
VRFGTLANSSGNESERSTRLASMSLPTCIRGWSNNHVEETPSLARNLLEFPRNWEDVHGEIDSPRGNAAQYNQCSGSIRLSPAVLLHKYLSDLDRIEIKYERPLAVSLKKAHLKINFHIHIDHLNYTALSQYSD